MPNGQYITRQYVSAIVAAAGGGGSSYLILEEFGSTPAGWTIGTAGAWTFNNSSPAMSGPFNAKAQSFSSPDFSVPFADQNEVWGFTLYNSVTIAGGSSRFKFRDSAGTILATFIIQSDGTLAAIAEGGGLSATVSTLSINTTYYLWFHYKKGTGSDAICDVSFSTNGIRPTSGNSFTSSTNGTGTVAAGQFYFIYNNNNTAEFVDRVIVNNSQIPDNP